MDEQAAGLRRGIRRLGFEREWWLIAAGAVIGTLTALGAIGFHEALVWTSSTVADMVESGGSLWLIPLAPVSGALITGYLVQRYARDARGHGVPQVITAVVRDKGVIPIRVGVVKIIASIATVGSGGSSGAEGPIVQIGATAGSAFGRLAKVGREYQNTFVGCGAAAGIASVFNAPIAGVLFVLEIILRDFSLRTFTPIVVSAVFSTALTQLILGENNAIFATQLANYQFDFAELPGYIVLGLICAALGVAFTKMLHAGEDAFERVPVHPMLKPAVGAAMLGLCGVAFVVLVQASGGEFAMPAFFGNGYETIRWVVEPLTFTDEAGQSPSGLVVTVTILLLIVAFKAVGTVLTLGSGGSGGVFAPSLMLGACAGGAFGLILSRMGLLPDGSSPAAYAAVGMGAVVAATTFAPLTSILLLFELTREPLVLLPVRLSSVMATVGAQLLMRNSIYTERLRQAGVLLGWTTDLAQMRKIPVASCDLARLPPEAIHPADPLSKLITMHAHHHVPDFPVVDHDTGAYIGMVTGMDLRTALVDREAIPLLLVAELMRTDLPVIRRDVTLDVAMDLFARHDVASLVVVSPIDDRLPMGMVTRASVLKRYREALDT